MASIFDNDTKYPALAELIRTTPMGGAAPPPNKSGWLGPGVSAGIDQFQALSGRGIQALGDAISSQRLADVGAGIAERNFAEAAKNGRPDLESFPTDNLMKVPAWLGYQAAKQLPTLALTAAAYKLGGARAAAMVPEEVLAAGASVPKWLGGGGLRAGMVGAEAAAAREAGARLVAGGLAQAPINYPQAVGSMYDEAIQAGDAGPGAAKAALLGGVPYSLAEGFQPATLGRMLEKGLAGNLAKRVATGAAVNAAQETLTEGIQTGMEQAFRPDLSPRDKMANIVEGALTGGAVGAVFGGVSGVRRLKTVDAAKVGDKDMADTVDQALGITSDKYTQQPTMEGIEPPEAGIGAEAYDPQTRQLRPFAGATDANLQGRLAQLEQRGVAESDFGGMFGEEPRRELNKQDMMLAQQLRAEMDRRAGVEAPSEELQALQTKNETAGGRVISQGPAPARNMIYEDRGTASAADIARRAELEQGPATYDPKRQFNLFAADDAAMPEQRPPSAKEKTPAEKLTEAETKSRTYATELIGEGKARWAKEIIEAPAQDETDVQANVISAINTLDEAGATVPTKLQKAAEKLGIMDSLGRPRDLKAERDAAVQRAETLWQRAKETGAGAGEAKVAQQEAKKLDVQVAALAAAQARVAQRTQVAEQVAAEAQAAAPKSALESAEILETAPALPPAKTLQQIFSQRGVAPTSTVVPETPRDASGTQAATLEKRMRNPARPKPQQAIAAAEARKQQVQDRLQRIANDTSLDELGKSGMLAKRGKLSKISIRQAALAAAEEYEKTGSEIAADRVIAAHQKATGGLVFSKQRLSETQPPMSDASFDQALLKAAQSLPRTAREAINVVNTAADLPGPVRAAAEDQGMHPNEIRGVLFDGKVYIVKDQVSSEASLREVINHEVFGHGGARALLGDQRNELLSRVFQMVGGLEGLRSLARFYGVERQLNSYLPGRELTAEDQVELTDELLAQAAGKHSGKFQTFVLAWVSRFKSALINALRAIGLNETAERLNTFDAADMALLMTEMRKAVERGQSMDGSGVSFDRNSPEFAEWFDGSQVVDAEGNPLVVYHGSKNEFSRFDLGKATSGTGMFEDSKVGFMFTNNPRAANMFSLMGQKRGTSGVTYPAYLSIKNPMVLDFSGYDSVKIDGKPKYTERGVFELAEKALGMPLSRSGDKLREAMIAAGYDGLHIINSSVGTTTPAMTRNMGGEAGGWDVWVALEPKQIKSQFETAPESASFLRATPQGMMDTVRGMVDASEVFERTLQSDPVQEAKIAGSKLHLYTSTVGHIVDWYGKLFQDPNNPDAPNALEEHRDAHRVRGVAEQRNAHLTKAVWDGFEKLRMASAKMAEAVETLMDYTSLEIDPRKTWDEHTWLQSKPNAADLKERVERANASYRKMNEPNNKLGRQAVAVYQSMIDLNESMHYAQQAQSLYKIMSMDESISQEMKDTMEDPMDELLRHPEIVDPKAVRDFWLKKANDLAAKGKTYVQTQRGLESESDASTKEKINASTSTIMSRIADMEREQQAMAQAPYFHMGRFGKYIISFKIKGAEGGAPDQASLEKIAKAFDDAKIRGVTVSTASQTPRAFMRFESKGQWDEAIKIARAMEAAGHASDVKHFDKDYETNTHDLGRQPQWAQQLMQSISSTMFGDSWNLDEKGEKLATALNAEFQRHVQQFFINQMPDTAINKVMVHRDYVVGASPDMARSFLFRAEVGGRALANLYASGKMSSANQKMYDLAKDARSSKDPDTALKMQRVVNELFRREAARPMIVGNNWVDRLRAFNHAYFLGLSPAHFLVNTTQIGVLLWPELAKRTSFVNAARTIGKVTPTALKIMRATLVEGKKLGWRNLPDASITPAVLKAAGVTGKEAEFIMRVVNSGLLDIGSQSREIGRVVEGQQDSKIEQGLRWASATGYYSEMFTRLVAALSARDVHGGSDEKMYKYVDETVRQSMLSYETWNQSRATGRMGLAGQMTPIMTSFMQYQFQVTEKLMREFHTAFTSGAANKEEKTAARKFLGAHLAAITTLAGSLGMPMAAVFAAVFDKMADMFGDDDDEPSNIQASWRNFLSDTFGQDVGEVLAKGLPRAIGIDVANRAGEQNFLPYGHSFARLLTDRRQWKDKVGEWALDTMGSPISMMSNIISGGGKIASGDILGGMRDAVPLAIRGPVNAFKMTTDGYVDGKGNKMPMEPNAWGTLMQAMGFTPAAKAEYTEARGTQQTLKGEMIRRAQVLRNDLVKAFEDGDQVAARDAYRAAAQFDEKNPQFAILPRFGSVLRSRAKERARAETSSTPLGIDPALADRSRFANFD